MLSEYLIGVDFGGRGGGGASIVLQFLIFYSILSFEIEMPVPNCVFICQAPLQINSKFYSLYFASSY